MTDWVIDHDDVDPRPYDTARCTAWANAFRRGVPSARVVLIPNADHYVYLTNEAQVIAEMNEFLASLH
jgi:non-heme chloroperoxidase